MGRYPALQTHVLQSVLILHMKEMHMIWKYLIHMHLIQNCVVHNEWCISKPWPHTPFPECDVQSFSQGPLSLRPSRQSTVETKIWITKIPLFECKNVWSKIYLKLLTWKGINTLPFSYSESLKIWGFSFELLMIHHRNLAHQLINRILLYYM